MPGRVRPSRSDRFRRCERSNRPRGRRCQDPDALLGFRRLETHWPRSDRSEVMRPAAFLLNSLFQRSSSVAFRLARSRLGLFRFSNDGVPVS